jgi:ferrous iron transport protein B
MSSCCSDTTDPTPAAVATSATLTVALAGNPNSGKTTIFNALTGLRQKVANYPGVTVEKKTGRCNLPDGSWVDVIDLPGTYSLISRSPDEQVAMEVLRGLRSDTKPPDVVVVVVDASNLQRNLYLVSQLIELGRPLVVALNMMDVAERRGLIVSPETLQRELGVPVVPVVGHKHKGVHDLKAAIRKAVVAPMPDWPLPQAMREELLVVGGGLAILDVEDGNTSDALPVGLNRYQRLAERMLIGDFAGDVLNFARREPVASLLSSSHSRLLQLGIDPMQADVEAHYRWIEDVTHRVVRHVDDPAPVMPEAPAPLAYASPTRQDFTRKLDAVLIHRVWGLLVFTAVMAVLFVSVFWVADPVMRACEDGVNWLGGKVGALLPEGPVKDLITDGIFKGVGGVVVFVPQIAMLFLFLAILEDSGYLARAAFLMDKLLAKVGLHGKSFIPLLSSFACAIPGIMATRTIENRKDRLATIFIAPFMSCSARLPVYFLLIGTFFAGYGSLAKGGIMLSLYLLGVIAAAGTAWVFKRTLLKGPAQAFILEMPSYKLPQLSQVARQVWFNTSKFLTKAGTIIFALSVVLWAMTYYPRLSNSQRGAVAAATPLRAMSATPPSVDSREYVYLPSDGYQRKLLLRPGFEPDPPEPEITLPRAEEEHAYIPEQDMTAMTPAERLEWAKTKQEAEVESAIASEQLRHSLAGRFGHLIEPVIRPLGYDWKMGVGLVGAFAAREVFVSTLAITYNAGSENDTASLEDALKADVYPSGPRAGQPVWTPLVAVSLLVWFVLAMQCMSTLAIVRRETGTWRWPVGMLVYMNGLAYVICLIVYQVGLRILG